jgi:transcriptional antiterminator RfaH
MDKVEVFLPRVRFKRATRHALTWVTEALFPGYLFAKFDWNDRLRQVQTARSVSNIVHFGDYWPAISDTTISELRVLVGPTGLHTIAPELSPGDAVLLTHDSLHGLRGLISRILPGQKRVEVLMEILGRKTGIEMAVDSVVKEGCERAALLRR